ncbi:phage tail protein, partial [Providencia rettgeri]
MSKPTGKLIRLTASDVGAYTKTEADTKIADAKKAGTDANNNANGRVPTSRKVNGKPLTADISLTAGDVEAYTKTEADTKIADAKKAGTDANTNANGRVPTSRKVNGKPLTADISLTAGDVSAYTKTEADTKIADAKKAGTDANTNANGRVP